MDKEFQVGKINNIILRIDNDIRSVNIFDVFEGGNLPEGKKLGYKLKIIEEKWLNNNFQLTDKEIIKILSH